MRRAIALSVAVVAASALVACGGGGKHSLDRQSNKKKTTPTGVIAPVSEATGSGAVSSSGLRLASSAFDNAGAIPVQFTCTGAGQSVPLAWSGVPAGTTTLALRMQDVDTAQKYVHWLVYGIKPSTKSVAAGQSPVGATQAKNSFGQASYAGPCPPPNGQRHRYVFTLLALGDAPDLSGTKNAQDAWAALEKSHVVGRVELTGTYERSAPPGGTKKG
jgi:Raf kinase inhibitor-like YbhB/YbcL family protein